jgi:hypothetical protein
MELWTVKDGDFVMSHLEKCPIWATCDIGSGYVEIQANVALNYEEAIDEAYGPYFIATEFQLDSGLQCEGYIGIQTFTFEPYIMAIWVNEEFCMFNKHMSIKSRLGMEMKTLNDAFETKLTPQDVFPIHYKLRLPEEFIDELELIGEGTFNLSD